MTTTLNTAEARIEYMRETRSALANGERLDQRAEKREAKADAWSRWFHERMNHKGCTAPELLPDAFARLEQLAEDRAAAMVRELKKTLREAFK
jgi:hypothetical protein